MVFSLRIDGTEVESEGSILDAVESLGKNPDSYLYLQDGVPVPMDTEPQNGQKINAVRVASGG